MLKMKINRFDFYLDIYLEFLVVHPNLNDITKGHERYIRSFLVFKHIKPQTLLLLT